MIDPKELRIGNLIYGVDTSESPWKQVVVVVEPRHIQDLVDIQPNPHEPIPLTEEWLLRFGFETADCEIDFMEYTKEYEKDSHVYSVCNRGGFDGHAENPFYVTISEGQKNGWSHDHEIDIKHVHQLQNFHFALTSQELTLKD